MARKKALEKVIGKVYKTAAEMDILDSCMNPEEIADVFRCWYTVKMYGFAETVYNVTADYYKKFGYCVFECSTNVEHGWRICE